MAIKEASISNPNGSGCRFAGVRGNSSTARHGFLVQTVDAVSQTFSVAELFRPVLPELLSLLVLPFLKAIRQPVAPFVLGHDSGNRNAVIQISQEGAGVLDSRHYGIQRGSIQRLKQLQRITKLLGDDSELVQALGRCAWRGGFVSLFQEVLRDAPQSPFRQFVSRFFCYSVLVWNGRRL